MMRWLLCGAVLWVCSVSLAYAGINHASNLDWKTQESTHFRIHFYAGEQALANRSLHIAESVYTRLTPILNWYPKEKTEIVLSDEMDMSNGFALPIPSNRITLFVSRPNSVSSLEDHAGWLETLILHEFVHTLHLDKARGGPKNIRNVFGRILLAFPNVFMPAWMHEGLATYYETDKKLGIGRGQSVYFQMMMRMEVDAGIKPVKQINQLNTLWPLATSRYLYGVYFYQFIADTYGEDTLPKIVETYSDHWLPFAINDLYEDVLGKDMTAIWDEFETYVNAKFQSQITHIKQQGLYEGERLSQTGDFKSSVLQADDGRIFYVSDNLENGAKLKKIYQGKSRTLLELNAGARLDWHEQAGLLMTQPDICDNANRYYDIYRVDADGDSKQLTHCQRYIFAAWSPDGSRIAAVKNYRGQHAIHLLDAKGKLLQVLWQGHDDETLSGLDWSADGKLLVSSVWRKNSGWDVETFDVTNQSWVKITDDILVETDARFVGGSHDIVYAAEHEGVYNIFKHEVSGKVKQLTQVLGGAFAPFINQKGQLLSIDYHAQGFDVYQLGQPLHQAVSFTKTASVFPYPQFPEQDISISKPVPYSAWDSALPTSWLPNLALTNQGVELGAFVFGSDVLNRHNYSLYAGYQSLVSSPVFNLDYIYDGWYPLLKLHAEQMQLPSFDNQNKLVALTENQRLDGELIFPWLKQQSRWTAHLALNHVSQSLSWLAPQYTALNTDFQDTLLGAALVYDTRLTYPRGISSASTGYVLSILAESGKGLGGTYTGNMLMLSGRQFNHLGNEQVLALRLDAGFADNTSRPFSVGGNNSINIIPNLLDPLPASASFNQRQYSLRGYADAALIGQHMLLASAEYRFLITRIEKGWMAPPIGIDSVFGQVFFDAARVGNDLNAAKTYSGIGAELGGDMVLFYSLPARLQLGYAKGLDDVIGGNQVYFRLGSSF
ncbi:BamA/TamA family outer membrane protein [Ghiorsea bivora]|uniref:BamA/TamA family outer membrane protein n=1 Tax=Ghiorsea bivora TaxID=1485545 RepID=UPI00056FC5BA|nr:BamA/TamA family outer membrane protein [Ghiorsea bivora]